MDKVHMRLDRTVSKHLNSTYTTFPKQEQVTSSCCTSHSEQRQRWKWLVAVTSVSGAQLTAWLIPHCMLTAASGTSVSKQIWQISFLLIPARSDKQGEVTSPFRLQVWSQKKKITSKEISVTSLHAPQKTGSLVRHQIRLLFFYFN